MKTKVYVNKQRLARGEPPISIRRPGQRIEQAFEVVILGRSKVINPNKKQSPRVWIECYAVVVKKR